jgi:hypothetical protein
MKAILIGGVVLMTAWLGGGGPGAAVPLQVAAPPAPTAPPLLIPARHHHHHRWNRRHGYSRGGEDDPSEPNLPGAEGQTGEVPAYPTREASSPTPRPSDRGSRAGTATAPSIRWVDPDRRVR